MFSTAILTITALTHIGMTSVSARPLMGRDGISENCYCYNPNDSSAHCSKPLVKSDAQAYLSTVGINPFHATDHSTFYCGLNNSPQTNL